MNRLIIFKKGDNSWDHPWSINFRCKNGRYNRIEPDMAKKFNRVYSRKQMENIKVFKDNPMNGYRCDIKEVLIEHKILFEKR